MASCQKCGKKLSCFTFRNARHPTPQGGGVLCEVCHRPYGLVLEKYATSLKHAQTCPKAAAWVAVCYLLTAQRVNLVRTVTAAILKISETEDSWKVCRQRAVEVATKAMFMPGSDSTGRVFLKALLNNAEKTTQPPPRTIPVQRHASVWGDVIRDIEHEAVEQCGLCMDELKEFVTLAPAGKWLLNS